MKRSGTFRCIVLSIYILISSNVNIVVALDSWFRNKTINMLTFFNDTYIEKVKGAWDFKKKFFKYDCFKEDWQLYHMHHVCTKGGYDGVLVGIEGIPNDWHHRSRKDNFMLSSEEWNKKTVGHISSHSHYTKSCIL